MEMSGYTKLFSEILTSSIWNEDDKVRILWITMLAMSDQHGLVTAAPTSIALMARMGREDFDRAIDKLQSPDPESRTADFDGRRITKTEEGFLILNYEKYRNKLLDGKEREQTRERVRRYRERQKEGNAKCNVTLRNPASASVSASDTTREAFDRCWKAYPDKSGSKHKAYEAYAKAVKAGETTEQAVLDGIARYIKSVEHKRKTFPELKYANGQTWFNQRRWESEYTVEEGGKVADQGKGRWHSL